ncbi:MAG: T9SS type A sorting domain-containing protein [Chitinophagales bacterium]|nr:T9SS type A sorting domain-containing protein [Chitinophagales bacterium]
MKYTISFFFIVILCFISLNISAQCAANNVEIIIIITPDQFPNETTWDLRDANDNVLASGGAVGDTLCMPDTMCLVFNIYDSYGDGIFSPGGYSLYYDNNLIISRSGYDFGNNEYWHIGCPPGFSCQSPISITEGSHTAPKSETWYSFKPDSVGTYIVKTCDSNSCNTMLWVYDVCTGINITDGIEGAIYWGDNECGINALLNTTLDAGTEYYIRVGDSANACGNNPINFLIEYMGQVTGCTDPTACNYEPLATISDSCIYAPNPNCPDGPDLIIDRNAVVSSIFLDQINNSDPCQVIEGCTTGSGLRKVLKFATHLKNIGTQDYYIGSPSTAPHLFDLNNCHGHAHYKGYADYVLFDDNGLELPVGFKMGFCVMDVTCTNGGTAKFSCSNMGISAGCDDIYGSSTTCNWLDVTDVDTGRYTLVIRTNWDQNPDALGRHEVDYKNNWTQVCIRLSYNTNGDLQFQLVNDCPVFVDCAGDTLGSSQFDCLGICNGSTITGDIDTNGVVGSSDVSLYLDGIINNSLVQTNCNDLNADGKLNITDLAFANRCSKPGGSPSKCEFPQGYFNINDTAKFKIVNVDWSAKYLDVAVLNPASRILGYQLNFSGITISNAVSMAKPSEFPDAASFSLGGNTVLHLSYLDSVIEKSMHYQSVVRVFWSSTTDTVICISSVEAVLNDNYENFVGIVDNGCIKDDGFPLNDLCGNAIPLVCGQTMHGNTINSSSIGSPAICMTPAHGNGVWYHITGNGEQFTISSCDTGTDFNTIIEVYSGDCSSLSCVAGNDNNVACADTLSSSVTFTSIPWVDYFVYVSGNSVSGEFELTVSCIDLCPDPSGLAVSSITDSSATVDWLSVNNSTYNIEVVPAGQNPGVGNNAIPIISGITGVNGPPVNFIGLNPGTSYDTYLLEDCGAGNVSGTIGPVNFNTLFGLPPNDQCADAILIQCDSFYIGSTTNSTTIDLPVTCVTSATAPGVWYRFPGIDGSVTVNTCGGITNYDTKMHVYSGSCGSLICVTGNDDNCGLKSSVTWTSVPGTDYFIRVSGYSNNTGNFSLNVSCIYNSPPPEPNDSCDNATSINCGDTINGSTVNATISMGGVCGPDITSPGVWYVHSGTGMDVTVATCNFADYDTRISIFSGSCGILNCIGGNDDFSGCAINTSRYTFQTTVGTDYYILVHGFQNATGDFSITLNCDTPCGPQPINDECLGAISLPLSEHNNCTATSGGNTCAFQAPQNPSCDPFGSIRDVWYYFNSGTDTGAEINISNVTAAGLSLAVYDGCAGNQIYCSDSAAGNHVLNGLTTGSDYYIQLWNDGGAMSGNFDICVTKAAPICNAPSSIFTTNVTPTGAVLNWDNMPNALNYEIRGRLISPAITSFVYLNFAQGTSSYQVTGIQTNKNFEWQARTLCSFGNSGWTGMDTFATTCQVPVIWTDNVSTNSATLKWTETPYALGYIIQGSAAGATKIVTLEITPGTTTSYVANSLANNTDYVWRITPVCNLPLKSQQYSVIDTFTTGPNSKLPAFGSNGGLTTLNIYPNPAKDKINIEIRKEGNELGSISIQDTRGVKVVELTEIPNIYRYRVNTKNLAKGVYYISYQSGVYKSATERVIVN